MTSYGMLIGSYQSMKVLAQISGHHVSKASAVSGAEASQPLSATLNVDAPSDGLMIKLVCAPLVMNCMKHLS
jgi:hypothetical protein